MISVMKLKNFDVAAASLEELIAVRAEVKLLAANYSDLNIDMPESFMDLLGNVDRCIDGLLRATRLAELKKLEAKRAALMTTDEKRQRLDTEIDAMKKKLGLGA